MVSLALTSRIDWYDKVISRELNKGLVGLRVANIYDLSSRIFLFKLAKPGTRQQLLIDSGFRCHLTGFTRTTAAAPSAFVQRLRRYLKSRRITSVVQIGSDRVIEISFSDGQYRLYLEFFAAGNLVLTDRDLSVLVLLRQVSEGDEDVDVKLGSQYSLKSKQNFAGIPTLTNERVRDTLAIQIQRASSATQAGGKKSKKKAGNDLLKALSAGFPEYPPQLLDHAFRVTSFDTLLKPEQVLQDDGHFPKLMTALQVADEICRTLGASDHVEGYIIAKTTDASRHEGAIHAQTEGIPTRDKLLYDDFHPFKPSQFEGKTGVSILEFDGFDKTVDEFYSSIESQKLESRLTEREENAKRKLETAKQEHEKRLGALQQLQELHVRKAQAIETNTHRVREATAAVNGLIGQGMDWMDIGKLIENEKPRQNAVALMIKLPLKLHENTVTLLLDEPPFGDEDEDSYDTSDSDLSNEEEEEKAAAAMTRTAADKRLAVDIDLALTPWANARQYYDQKKTAAVKEQKTIQASTKALKNTELKVEADLKKGLKQEKEALRPARKQFWFEKFVYFISSDGYLVLGGKDTQQGETLYRRYLKKGDVYVHADLQGASSVIVKNTITAPDAPIPPSTLSQAGALCVCTSSAWDSKAVMAAWWVNADQVSKTAPTGEYLTAGGFVVRGTKNFLPPSRLLLGFAVLFLVSDESKANHSKHWLQITTSMPSEAVDADSLAEHAQNLRVTDDESATGSADEEEHDHEDSAEGTQEEAALEPDAGAVGHLEPDSDNEQTYDHGESAHGSDLEDEIANPLQPRSKQHEAVPAIEGAADKGAEVLAEQPKAAEDADATDGKASFGLEEKSSPVVEPDTAASNATPDSLFAIKQKQAIQPRGKRSKAKKAAKKYADQDEEDRALAMQLLGSAKAQEKKESAALEKAAREAKFAADKERRRAQHERAMQTEHLRQERLNAGDVASGIEDDVGMTEQERLELANLDALVGTPIAGDQILAALPVVAPWSALAKCKYKIKLQPGSVKKGKAVREIVTRWTNAGKLGPKVVDEGAKDRERIWPREIEAIKAWRVEEVIGLVPVGKVRLVQGGGLGGGASTNPSSGGKTKAAGVARSGRGSKKPR